MRNTNPGLRPIRKGGWHALWHFLFNITLVNSYLLSGFKDQYKFRTELLYTLFLKGPRQPWKHIQDRTIGLPRALGQVHKLASRQALRYCSVCQESPTTKRKRFVLGEITGNSRSEPLQKRKKTTYGCITCGLALCKEGNCYKNHCNSR
jgi:hypothetical protein